MRAVYRINLKREIVAVVVYHKIENREFYLFSYINEWQRKTVGSEYIQPCMNADKSPRECMFDSIKRYNLPKPQNEIVARVYENWLRVNR